MDVSDYDDVDKTSLQWLLFQETAETATAAIAGPQFSDRNETKEEPTQEELDIESFIDDNTKCPDG